MQEQEVSQSEMYARFVGPNMERLGMPQMSCVNVLKLGND